jgi:rubrerythrin
MDKRYWKCTVCNDLHYGTAGPEKCPSCQKINKYVEITQTKAFNIVMG